MKKIYESVAMGILAVNELGDLIRDERNEDKRETLECSRYAYFYLINNLNKQFGISHENVVEGLVGIGYDRHMAYDIIKSYEKWACHVIKLNECGDNT